MESENNFLDEITISLIKEKFIYLNNYYNFYCRPQYKIELILNESKTDDDGVIYEGIIYITPNITNILLKFVIELNPTPIEYIKIFYHGKYLIIDFLIIWVYFITYNIVTNNGTTITTYFITDTETSKSSIFTLSVNMVKHIQKMNEDCYIRKKFIDSCKQMGLITQNSRSTITMSRQRKEPHELTKQFKPKTILKFNSSSSSSSSQTKKLYKKRYGIKVLSNQNRFKTTKRISHINSDMRSKLRKYAELPTKYPSEVESDYDINIGLLIITSHGLVKFTSINIPIIDIPPNIKNTYYKSSSKPGCKSFRPKKHKSIDNPNSIEQRRNNMETCFRKTVNKREFSKYFFECDADKHKLFMRYLSKNLDNSKLSSLQANNMYKPDVYNGKVKKLLYKLFETNFEEDTDEDNPHNQIIFILYNTVNKTYTKLNLLNKDDIKKLCLYIKDNNIRNEEQFKKLEDIYHQIHTGLTKYFVGTNLIKKINMKDILTLLSFLELEDLYIYDDSCSDFVLPQYIIEAIKKKGKTIDEVHQQISKVIRKEAPIQKIGI
jgi:ribosomal protein S8E